MPGKRRSPKRSSKQDIHKQFKPNKSPKQVLKWGHSVELILDLFIHLFLQKIYFRRCYAWFT